MSQYIITIVPVAEDGLSGPALQTMVRIDTTGEQAIVTELTMRVPEGSGLAAACLPYVDFGMLVAAFTPPQCQRPQPAQMATPAPERALEPVVPNVAVRSGSTKRGGPAAGRTTVAKPNHLGASRAYRKAPDVADLEAAYVKTGTIIGVAEHFGVPVHTAQGWITRMRRKNSLLAPG